MAAKAGRNEIKFARRMKELGIKYNIDRGNIPVFGDIKTSVDGKFIEGNTKKHFKFAQIKHGCTIKASVFHWNNMSGITTKAGFLKLINANIIK